MWLILSLVIGFVVYMAACSRDRAGFGWLAYCLLLWPVALLHMLVVPSPSAARAAEADAGRIPCPFCAEAILPAARICPHCRSGLAPAQGADPPEAENDRQLRELIAAARRRDSA